MKNKRKAFTLVELLAVIVILAVILVIAIPRIQHVIENSRKEAISSSVKMVAASAETEYAKREALGENSGVIECNEVSKLNDIDYASCDISLDNRKATVTIVGSGKFDGYTCTGNRNIVECFKAGPKVKVTLDLDGEIKEVEYTEGSTVTLETPTKEGYTFKGWGLVSGEGASIEGNVLTIGTGEVSLMALWEEDAPTSAEFIESLYNTAATENGLSIDTTADTNIRYVGASPKNYVTYNNELWRIIGIFDIKTTEDGVAEPRIKLIRNESIGTYSWDSSKGYPNPINAGYGINQWGASGSYEGADIMRVLNGAYLNQSSGLCCTYEGVETCSITCDFSSTSTIKGLDSTARSLIDDALWYTGATGNVTLPVLSAYNYERSGTLSGKACGSSYCTDTVTRTTTWTGKIGLIYASDYGYASTDTSCRANMYDYTNKSCKNNNWLNVSTYWTMTPINSSVRNSNVWNVLSGYLKDNSAYFKYSIRPVVYLKSDVKIVEGSGDGSSETPYQLSL